MRQEYSTFWKRFHKQQKAPAKSVNKKCIFALTQKRK